MRRAIAIGTALILVCGGLGYWASKSAEGFTTGLTLATALIVLWYTAETSAMRQEMVLARKRREVPEVIIRLDIVRSGFYDLVVENASDVPARNIRFAKYPPWLIGPSAVHIPGNVGFLIHGIDYLAPRQSRRSFFVNYPALGPNGQQGTITFVYSFQDTQGNPFQRTVPLNLASYHNNLALEEPAAE